MTTPPTYLAARPLCLLALCLLLTAACTNRRDANGQPVGTENALAGKAAVIEFAEKTPHDFGQITEGDTVEHLYSFKNTGELPLLINNITASCGCTTPDWPRQPVAPGETSTVRVRFNSRNKVGEQRKTVTVYANTQPPITTIEFKVLVAAKPGAAKKPS